MALSALLDILVILVAAKLAAEASERLGLPAVVGEILAGIVIGPSLLALVEPSDVLSVLAELGVILLLLDVGLEMDLRELGAVGRAALAVAVVGVVVPFAAGIGVGFALGFDTNEAIFVAAALTATSVGISARVFGDLRALASVEARTVLGAAVADDVLGLIILTVVVRLTESGSVRVIDVGEILVVAVLFLAVSLAAGVRLVPPLFDAIGRWSRSAGTVVALALAFALAVAELADAAKLAPIVGAFVAGITLARSRSAGRIRADLAPVGHLFIPVFFLQIGIEAEVDRFVDGKVLGIAAALLAVAIAGKLVASAGLIGAPGDRLLVGLGMIPRGEVGLIFATIGLQQGVFGDDVYAALLIVVLVTTLITPPLLRQRLVKVRKRPVAAGGEPGAVEVDVRHDEVGFRGVANLDSALVLALEAAVHIEDRRPSSELLDLLSGLPDDTMTWTERARAALLVLLERGGPRAWRFLFVTGVLRRALPELDAAIGDHIDDPFDLDPLGSMRWNRLGRLMDLGLGASKRPEQLALAALAVDATDGELAEAEVLAGQIAGRIGTGPDMAVEAAQLAADAGLLVGVARRADGFGEDAVMQLAAHMDSPDRVRDLHRLTLAVYPMETDQRAAVENLVELVVDVLTEPRPARASASVDRRRKEAMAMAADPEVRQTIALAPRAYVLTQSPSALLRQARLCSPSLQGDQVRVRVATVERERVLVEMAARDRLGLLAHEARVLGDVGLDVLEATVATWPDGTALAVFKTRAFDPPSADRIRDVLVADLGQPLQTPPTPDVILHFDDDASPWHTLCTVEAPDRYGLLSLVAAAFAAGGANVHAARIVTFGDEVVDQFELTGRLGRKLTDDVKERARAALHDGVRVRQRSRRRR
jgi:Kef-type K+ transport system membrane component KefB